MPERIFTNFLAACLGVLLILGAPLGPPNAAAESGSTLRWIEFSVAGRPVKVKAGGVLALHPDAPFRVTKIKSSSWLDLGLKARLVEMPDVDLERFHSLGELLGPRVYHRRKVVVQAYKGGRVLGQVEILVRLLPIDWLRLAESANNLSEKIQYTKRALELSPDDRLLIEHLVDLLEEAHRYQEAVRLLEQRAALGNDPRWLRRLAGLYRKLEKPQREAAVLSKLLADGQGGPEDMKRLAELYQAQNRWEEAAQLWQRLLAHRSGRQRAETYLRLAQALSRAGHPKRAAQAWDQAARLAPLDPSLWRQAAQAKKQIGDEQGYLQALEKAVSLAPADRELLLELAQAQQEAGHRRRAAELLEKALLLKPGDETLLMRLVDLYRQLNDDKALLATYRRLAKLKPDDKDLQYNLAVLSAKALQGKKELRQALKQYWRAARLNPGDAGLLMKIAKLCGKLGDKKGQLEAYRRLVKLAPKDPILRYNLAVLAQEQGRHKLALEQLKAAQALRPDDPDIRDLLLEELIAQKRWKELQRQVKDYLNKTKDPNHIIDMLYSELAQERPRLLESILKRASRIQPKNPRFYKLRAALALDRDDEAGAIAALEEAVKALPGDLDLLFKLAELYEAQGKDQKALALLGRILDRNPDYPKAQERYLQIKTRQLGKQRKAGQPAGTD